MAGEHDFKDAQGLLEGARAARINLCVFEHDTKVPGEVAAISRLLWKTIPELCKREGAQIDPEKEGHPPGVKSSEEWLTKSIGRDVEEGRPIISWLAKVATDQTKSMFAKGADNSLDAFLEAFSKKHGFQRRDVLAVEAGRAEPAPEPDFRRPAAAMASYVMGQQRSR